MEPIYPGTPIDFIPTWLASIWRLVLFVASAFLLGQLAVMNYRRYGHWQWRSRSFMWLHFALVWAVMGSVVLQIERFDDRVVLEGLPAFTVLTILIGLGVRSYSRGE